MGILDFLGDGSAPGSLLSFLQGNAQNQQFPGLLASDTAQYTPQSDAPAAPLSMAGPQAPQPAQPSPLDNAAWPSGPVGAPSNANAAMPAVPAPQPVPANPPPVVAASPNAPSQPATSPLSTAASTIGDRLGAGFRGMMANAPAGPVGALMGGIAGLSGMGQDTPQQKQAKALTATGQALIAKNVDPAAVQAAQLQAAAGNSKPLSDLFTQAYGPQTIQSIGNGYIVDKSGKVTRAYTPEDKIPQGFTQDDAGNLHFTPGGPADPAYLRSAEATKKDPNAAYVLGRGGEVVKNNPDGSVAVLHKNVQDITDATLDDATTKAMASQYLAGDRTVMQNLGRGAQGAANIVKLRGEIYKQAGAAGLDGKGIVDNFNEQAGALAGQRTVGTRAANISLAANEANNMIPVALEASDKVPRGSWVPWNQAVQAYQKGTSSPELASFVAATNSLVNAYVRAVSPGGVPTDSMREHAYSMLNSAQGPDAFKAVVSTMQKEMQAALGAPAQVQKELRRSPAPAGDTPTPNSGTTVGGVKWSVQ